MNERIVSLKIRDIRCFAGEQTAEFGRKVTLVVGENSTGKSTLLGCYKAFSDLCGDVGLRIDGMNYFDKKPFMMGNFDTISTKEKDKCLIGGGFEGHRYSKVEFELMRGEKSIPVDSRMTIGFEGSETVPNLTISSPLESRQKWQFRLQDLQDSIERIVAVESGAISYMQPSSWFFNYVSQGVLPYGGDYKVFLKSMPSATTDQRDNFIKLMNLLKKSVRDENTNPFIVEALPPERDPRQRSYANPPINTTEVIMDYLGKQGKKLKLFSNIKIEEDSQGSQILIERAGLWYNIMDVGYGIHSILPVLMATYDKPSNTTFLMQQPEVNLHPHAQALLAQVMAESEHRFIVETHSDYIIDRLRICVMRGEIEPEDFSIVYCELSDNKEDVSTIYNISVDKEGNLINCPEGYRRFFNDEINSLLGLT